jgi:tRNA-splicing ligase RtcB
MIEIREAGFRVPIKSWLPPEEIEPGAMDQLRNAARHPEVAPHVAVMPDCHVGYGVTIGCVLPTVGSVLPNAVGVDIGCFAGETEVPTLDGRSYPIADLARRGEDVLVYASTPDGKVVAAWAMASRTRSAAPLVEIELDNGEKIRCTPDHEFMLRDGDYARADALAPGTSLMPFYRRTTKDGHLLVQQNHSGWWQKAHWLVARSGLLGPIPKRVNGQRTVIHHADLDPANNLPTNLAFMGKDDHSRLHRSIPERNRHWRSDEFEQRRVAALAAKAAKPEGHAYFAERGSRNIETWMAEHPDEFAASVAGNGERGAPYLAAYNGSEAGRAKSREVGARIHECPARGARIKGNAAFYASHPKRCRAATHNHKVAAVHPLAEREDVYCLSVPGYNNFALAAGVFVHNCGMAAIATTSKLDPERMSQKFWRNWAGRVARDVPTGFAAHKRPQDLGELERPLRAGKLQSLVRDKAAVQIGTLGGGNHFLEAQVDETGAIWLMVHSGSRHTGLRIANHYHDLAVASSAQRRLDAPPDLASLPLDDGAGQDYLHDMGWAVDFALQNRLRMMDAMIKALEVYLNDEIVGRALINIPHNFARPEAVGGRGLVIHRKGATSADVGQLGIIPGSMGSPSYIVRGKGNEESLRSCSHGAGRRMGRNVAKKAITEAEFATSLAGTYSRPSAAYIDEAPAAYKDVERVVARQSDLIDVVHTLRPLITLKGDSRAKED